MKISVKIVLIQSLFIVVSSCKSNSQNEEKLSKPEIVYDGYVDMEANSLDPSNFKGKYYFDIRIKVEANDQVWMNDEKIKLTSLIEEINRKWEIIEKEDYKAFLHLGIAHSKEAAYDFYLKVYKSIENFKINQKETYSKSRFGQSYSSLDKTDKRVVDKTILIHIVETEPEINWDK